MTDTPDRDGGPAFACAAENGHQPGMSLRDYFAAQVITGLAISWGKEPADSDYGTATAAESAYKLADAMLAARTGVTNG